MITDEDIQRIIAAEREVFPTKNEFSGFQDTMREHISDVQSSVDAYAHKADTYFQEMAALAHKVDRLERQIHTIAKKTGVSLDDF